MPTIKSRLGSLAACMLQRPVWLGGIKVSAVVGTILNLVNQGPSLFAGHDPSWVGLMLNYVIPFCVSVYSGACVAMHGRIQQEARSGTSAGQ